ncbi:TPA: hypothetical protein RZA60_000064 [Vibrio vulnificus]|nr:hypothetical protein [Vibrio vulnificus]HDY7622396.1 hypothetical protein [Vibrio vulnificus]HEB2779784.1 hypothetical protein [Vibrio vulnificus]
MYDTHLELQHILLEVKAERWHAIERFLFPYYCYQHQLLTRQGKPDWLLAREKLPRSSSVITTKQCVIEPLVPEQRIVGLLKAHWKDHEQISLLSLTSLFEQWLHYAVITKDEQASLKEAGLENAMPREWYHQEQPSVEARFEKVGIKINR